jgi:hypothetical protein
MFFSKSTALKAILPVAGAALAAGMIGAAAPAKAMTITLDNFSQTIPGTLTNTVGTAPTTAGPATFTGTTLLGATRRFSVDANGSAGDESSLRINATSKRLIQSNDTGVSSVNLVTYSFNATDFSNTPIVSFNYNADGGDVGSSYRFLFTLGGITRAGNLQSGVGGANLLQEFDFRGETLSGLTSAVLQIEAGSGRDITLSTPIVASRPNSVPVPPAVLATGVGAVIGGLKASRKRKQEAVMA